MSSGSRGRRVGWAVGLFAIVTLLFIGSWIYWVGDGRPGTPDEFRRQVADMGLEVAWSNSGPRGGSGVVDIDDFDGELWIRWSGNRASITREIVDAFLSCSAN